MASGRQCGRIAWNINLNNTLSGRGAGWAGSVLMVTCVLLKPC